MVFINFETLKIIPAYLNGNVARHVKLDLNIWNVQLYK